MNSDSRNYYISMVKTYPLLSAEEEKNLSLKIQQGDKIALNKLVNSNLRLVVSIASKFKRTEFSFSDLIQEGNIGLMIAAEKYNHSYETRFSTYAYPWILQYMLRYCSLENNMIQLPHRKEEMIKKIYKAKTYLMQKNEREPQLSELALYLGLTEEKVANYLSYSYAVSSLDNPIDDGKSEIFMSDILPETSFTPEEKIVLEDEKKSIRGLLNLLPKNEKLVLWYRFNLNHDKKRKSLREISDIIGISPEAVRQTEIRALKHIKKVVSF
jgi:RNA polymerase primary sigma factor